MKPSVIEDLVGCQEAKDDILEHIWELQHSSKFVAREALREIAKSFHKGLVPVRPGAIPREEDRGLICRLVTVSQAVYAAEREKLRIEYQNDAVMVEEIDKLSERLAAQLPEPIREQARRSIRAVLKENCPDRRPRQWRDGFGVAVAAKYFKYSPRQIQSILKNARTKE